jgi:NAD-dependent dihydropyrimidine dehydrogenase PreA subunit
MIEHVLADRCTGCGACVEVCPADVFDLNPRGLAVIARPDACQTCFMCELYCRFDALYVAPRCDARTAVPEAVARRGAGQFRRESGWDEWAGDPAYANEHWRMDEIFARARAMGQR